MFGRKQPAPAATQEPQDSTVLVTYLTTSCAWCLSEQGLPMGDGSHGICSEHAQEVREQAQDRRRRKEARP